MTEIVVKISLEEEDLPVHISIAVRPQKKRQAVRIALLDEDHKEIEMENISADSKRIATAEARDSKNRPSQFLAGDVPVWSIQTATPADAALLFPAPDGLTCEVVHNKPGTATVLVTGKNELGAAIQGTADYTLGPIPPADHIEVISGPEIPV